MRFAFPPCVRCREPIGFTCTTSCGPGCNSKYWDAGTPCDWERATYQLGLIEYYHASGDPDALAQAFAWAESVDYKLCRRNVTSGSNAAQILDAGPHNADHQLAGASPFIGAHAAWLCPHEHVMLPNAPSTRHNHLPATIILQAWNIIQTWCNVASGCVLNSMLLH